MRTFRTVMLRGGEAALNLGATARVFNNPRRCYICKTFLCGNKKVPTKRSIYEITHRHIASGDILHVAYRRLGPTNVRTRAALCLRVYRSQSGCTLISPTNRFHGLLPL